MMHQIIWIEKKGIVHHVADSDFMTAFHKALKEEGFKHTRLLKEWNSSTGNVMLYVDMEVAK